MTGTGAIGSFRAKRIGREETTQTVIDVIVVSDAENTVFYLNKGL